MIYLIPMRKQKRRKVIVVLWLAGSAGRKQLTGILHYVNSGHPWSVHLVTDPKGFTNEMIHKAVSDGIDGFIVHTDAQAAEGLASSTIPTVLMDFPPPKLSKRKHAIAVILDSDEDIGKVAADYFLQLGRFGSYAFIPDRENRGWSRLRERGYKNALLKKGIDCQVFGTDKGSLADWLKNLPKPVAALCAYDLGAQDVFEACRQAKLSVPDQVAVLGVDNDELICDYSEPSLSSVRIDHEALGFEAARTLERLMRRPTDGELKRIFMPADSVVERESTAPTAPAAHLVARALAFIKAHATDGITVSDVVRHLGVSRRLLDRRFGATAGTSIHKAIENRRLEQVKHRLATSNMPIAKISHLCGYANAQRLKYVFRQRYGCSMSEWREASSMYCVSP